MSIQALFNRSCPQIEIYLPDHDRKIEVIVDTGFYGQLALTNDLIHELNLKQIATSTINTANKKEESVPVYNVVISWFGARISVSVLGLRGKSNLLGMKMLEYRPQLGHRLTDHRHTMIDTPPALPNYITIV